MKNRRTAGGFTLIELMVVIAIIGVLVTVAVVSLSPGEHSASVRGFSNELASRLELAHQRSIATSRIHRVEVRAGQVNLWQAKTEGMATPTDWDFVSQLAAARDVRVVAADDRAHLASNDGVPGAGAGIPKVIEFKPDGSAEAATFFVGSRDGQRRARVLVFGATSAVHVWDGW